MQLDGSNMFILFAIVFFTFYMFFVDKDVYRNFFIAILLAIFVYRTYMSATTLKKEKDTIDIFCAQLELEIKDLEFVFKNIYPLHKAPKDLKYLRKDEQISTIIYNLRSLLIYDKYSYLNVVVLLEYFLKIHFNVLLGKYDPSLYEQILKDTCAEVVNTLTAMTINIPTISTVVEVPKTFGVPNDHFEAYIAKNVLLLHAILKDNLKILRRKYGYKQAVPEDFDDRKEQAFSLI